MSFNEAHQAGGPVATNRFVYHKSNPMFREQIDREGLVPQGRGPNWLSATPIQGKVIFATNSENPEWWFDHGYDDDIYRIDTSLIGNAWYSDPNFPGSLLYVITHERVPREAITLIHRGTGESKE